MLMFRILFLLFIIVFLFACDLGTDCPSFSNGMLDEREVMHDINRVVCTYVFNFGADSSSFRCPDAPLPLGLGPGFRKDTEVCTGSSRTCECSYYKEFF